VRCPCAGTRTEYDEDGGRGLLLIETLGKDWGAYRKTDGKVVWCLIAAEP
jgi:hypothetical protein